MTKEGQSEYGRVDLSNLWVGISNREINEERKKELNLIRSTLSPTAIDLLFPEPSRAAPSRAPFITTPSMFEEFIENLDPDWQKKSNFSLVPALQDLFQTLKNVEGEPHIVYAELRGLYRIFMLQDLLKSDWRPGREDFEIKSSQMEKDKQLKSRVRRLADNAHSDTWRYFSDRGYENWKIAQAEVIAYMETESPSWRRVFKNTKRGLEQ